MYVMEFTWKSMNIILITLIELNSARHPPVTRIPQNYDPLVASYAM